MTFLDCCRKRRFAALFLAVLLPSVAFAGISEPLQTKETKNSVKVRWKPLLFESLFFLGVEQGFRLSTQNYTRHYMRGKFFEDWGASIGNLHGWGDGDGFITNYVGHPMQGAVAGYIFVQNDPKYQKVEFGNNREYWKSRVRATLFSFAYSEQFELGPISEASIGNAPAYFPQQGLVDHVITPVIGMVWMIGEDATDKYLIRRIEARTDKRWVKIIARGALNPSRAMANAMRIEVPWHRDTRSDHLGLQTVLTAHHETGPQGMALVPKATATAGAASLIESAPPSSNGPNSTATVPAYELVTTYNYTRLATGKPGALNCNGGGGAVTWNANAWFGLTADVGGCKMMLPETNISGDSLSYLAGPRLTWRSSTSWVPFAQVLIGGDKLSTETIYPELKPPGTSDLSQLALPPVHARYTAQAQTNSFAIKFGVGVDRVLNSVLALRIADVEDTHLWAREFNGRHYPNNLSVSTGIIVRFGTW